MLPTLVGNTRAQRKSWWLDNDGRWNVSKEWDDKLTYAFEVADAMGSGETLSAVTIDEVSGPTITSPTVSGTTLSLTVTGAGSARAKLTTSSSRIFYMRFRWVPTDRADTGDAYA